MGTKPGIQRGKNLVYFAGCILVGIFLPGCFFTSMFRPLTVSVDTRQERYLNLTEKYIHDNDFKSAARDNDQVLEYYKTRFHAGDNVLANYVRQVEINQTLLARIISDQGRIISDQGRILSLSDKFQSCAKNQQEDKHRIESLSLQTNKLTEQIKKLETEKHLLEEQIMRLKQIDLNRGKAKPKRLKSDKASAPQ
jgi:hypothetical protein